MQNFLLFPHQFFEDIEKLKKMKKDKLEEHLRQADEYLQWLDS